ncbi:virginiamycin B lyase family protein [Streptomyces sp. NPDC055005]
MPRSAVPETLRRPAGAGRRLGSVLVLATLCAFGLGPVAAATASDPAVGAVPAPLYVSDYGNNRVLRAPADGSGGQSTVPTTDLVRPTGMVADAAGDLYVSDTGNNRVVRIPSDGGPQTTVPTDGLSRPLGLALDDAGDLYIADSFNDRVVKVHADGSGQSTVPTSGLLHPWGLAFDAEGSLYVSDFVNDRVVRLAAAGGGQSTVPTTGLSQPAGIVLDPRGNLYVSDTGNNRVVRVAAGGGQSTVPAVGLNDPLGLALDERGNLYVADAFNNRVVRLAPNGGGQSTLPFTGLNTPTGLAIPPAPTRLRTTDATARREADPRALTVKGLSGTLTTAHGAPVPGRTVIFSDAGRERTLCTAVTDSRGTARCDARIHAPAGVLDHLYENLLRRGYLARFEGSPTHAPAVAPGAVRAARPH